MISVADLMHGVHTLSVTVDPTTVTTRIDGKIIEDRGRRIGSDVNPINGFVGVRTGLGEDATIHAVKVTAANGGTLLSTDFSDSNPFGVGEIKSAGLELEGPLEGVWQPNDRRHAVAADGVRRAARRSPGRGSMPRRAASTR